MNAIELLKADHASVQALFRQYEAAGNQAQPQRELAEQIFTALEVHAALEEELFYPAVRAQLGTVTVEEEPTDAAEGDADTDEAGGDAETDLIAGALEEHQEVKTLIATLRRWHHQSSTSVEQTRGYTNPMPVHEGVSQINTHR